jgi:preprotein translocase subunit YajC
MKAVKTMWVMVVVLALAVFYLPAVHAQQPAQQQQQMQQQQMTEQQKQVMRMGEMMARMQHLQERVHSMVIMMNQGTEMPHLQMREQYRLMQNLNESMDAMIKEAKSALESYQVLMENETLRSDKIMQQDMKQLHEHFQDIVEQFGQTIKLLESMNQRLIKQGGGQ